MVPLIEIKTVPLQLQIRTRNAQLEYTRGTAEMEISRSENGLDIKSRAVKVQLDSFEAQNSLHPTPARSVEQAAQAGSQAAYEATSTYASHGQLLLNAKLGQEMVTQFAQEASETSNGDFESNIGLDFTPKTGVDIQWEGGDMQIRYEMDKLNFDWKIDQAQFKFTPGDIEISIAQRSEMTIKYVGGPVYVPPSSDPNYRPVDVRA